MNRIIRTKHLVCQNGDVSWWHPTERRYRFLGHIDNMPRRLPIELRGEWELVWDVLFEEFVKAMEAEDAGFE